MLSPYLYLSKPSPFFEQIDPADLGPNDYLETVARFLPPGWESQIGFPWSMFSPKHARLLLQGWKIHLSATEDTAVTLLDRAVPVIAETGTAFKLLTNSRVLRMATSKNWDRRAAGKFVTVYPASDAVCAALLKRLSEVTDDLTGPYVLTDRPFRNSQVVFYRYGAHLGHAGIGPGGEKEHRIIDPSGQAVTDFRLPYFCPPEWVTDPFSLPSDEKEDSSEMISLKDDRYAVNGALRYSSFGGIYTADDTLLKRKVVLREARPHAVLAKKRLLFEAALLKALAPLRRTPEFIDLFTEHGHTYLVQSRLSTVTLWGHAAGFLVTYEHHRSAADLLDCIVTSFSDIVEGVAHIHHEGFVLRDLTKTNVLLDATTGRAFFIDFELAYAIDSGDPWVPGGTPGYLSPNQQMNGRPTAEDDYYALGALLLDMLSFTAPALGIARVVALKACGITLEECGLPQALCELVRDLTDPDPQARPRPEAIRSRLEMISKARVSIPSDPIMTGVYSPPLSFLDRSEVLHGAADANRLIRKHILDHTEWNRDDRLWPGSAELFRTNPVCLRFGASGIATYLLRNGGLGDQEDAVWSWILKRSDPTRCPPGFYSGLSGVAWAAAQAGRTSDARRLIDRAIAGCDTLRSPGIQDGVAGVGLTALSLAFSLRAEHLLAEAIRLGDVLLERATSDLGQKTIWWSVADRIPLGYGAGPSGIALFFLHLYKATNRMDFLVASEKALTYEVQRLVYIGDRGNLPEFSDSEGKQVSPHVRYGSGGLVSVLLRYLAITEDCRFNPAIESCLLTVASRQTNKLWQDWGLAGFGETLLDAYLILGTQEHYEASIHIARKLLAFASEHEGGITYLGNELLRFSEDFGLGAAGIGSFFSRVANPKFDRIGFFDELLFPDSVGPAKGIKSGTDNLL